MSLSKKASSLLDQAEARLLRLVERERGEIAEVPLSLDPLTSTSPADSKARE
jgi:hypothetical protein